MRLPPAVTILNLIGHGGRIEHWPHYGGRALSRSEYTSRWVGIEFIAAKIGCT
jgi:hypothetical protein